MSILFPTSLDTLVTPNSSQYMDDTWVEATVIIGNLNDAVEALETKVWINWSADTSSLDYKTSRQTAKWDLSVHNGTSLAKLPVWTNGYMLVADSTKPTWLDYIAPTSWGTVTSMAFTNTNWVNGIISNPTTDPALAISFPNAWLQKSNGTALSSATAWTDYSVPTGTETLLNKTLTSPTLTTPVINIGSDANWDTYYRNAGTTKRLPIGSEWQFNIVSWGVPVWDDAFTYTGTYIADSTSASWTWNTYPTTSRLIWNITIANISLNWAAWSSYVEYSPNGSIWTTIITTTWTATFPLLLKSWYYYRVTASATVNWPTSAASINYVQ